MEWVRIDGVVEELFDVIVLGRVTCPSVIGLKGEEIHRLLNIDA